MSCDSYAAAVTWATQWLCTQLSTTAMQWVSDEALDGLATSTAAAKNDYEREVISAVFIENG